MNAIITFSFEYIVDYSFQMRFESTLNSICDSVGIQDAPKTLKVKPFDRMMTTILFTTVIFMGGFIPCMVARGLFRPREASHFTRSKARG